MNILLVYNLYKEKPYIIQYKRKNITVEEYLYRVLRFITIVDIKLLQLMNICIECLGLLSLFI